MAGQRWEGGRCGKAGADARARRGRQRRFGKQATPHGRPWLQGPPNRSAMSATSTIYEGASPERTPYGKSGVINMLVLAIRPGPTTARARRSVRPRRFVPSWAPAQRALLPRHDACLRMAAKSLISRVYLTHAEHRQSATELRREYAKCLRNGLHHPARPRARLPRRTGWPGGIDVESSL